MKLFVHIRGGRAVLWWLGVFITGIARAAEPGALLRGQVLDSADGKPVAARVYVRHEDGRWFFARSAAPEGSAVRYEKKRRDLADSIEMHTTLSAHPFEVEVPPGRVTITVERGKEYFPLSRELEIKGGEMRESFALKRWVNTAARGWFSGDTHVHRPMADLPNLMQAEDLNVAFPLSYWVVRIAESPATSERTLQVDRKVGELVRLDSTHVFWPRNTEYEITSTAAGKRHTLGAFFVLGHKSVLTASAPPVTPVTRLAREEGALIELDKHNWPWSMALVPVMKVDLFELSNNHVWRTEFAEKKFAVPPAPWMTTGWSAEAGFSERGWIEYGLVNYYALLDCGFRLRPTAGTASGVHPVPLGFGRVYVHLDGAFNYDDWLKALNAGRSFVTTGPMLFATLDGKDPGAVFNPGKSSPPRMRVAGTILSEQPLAAIEIVVNGVVVGTIAPRNKPTAEGAFASEIDERVKLDGSSWVALRCWENRSGGRIRFAHTAPWHVEVPDKPLRPRRAEVEFLVQRVADEIKRSTGEIPAAALEEYRQALAAYEALLPTAR